jgi:Predicted pyridoxal phosphate-dependent enzyme apparently involved in regulation of cell wall biogenesis
MKLSKWPFYSNEEIDAVKDILISGNVNAWTGDNVNSFEKEFAKYFQTKYAIALANGTLALTAAYKAIGIKSNDEIITTPRTFIATSSTAMLLGAKILFADVDENSGNIDSHSIERLISEKTKCITVVHLAGWPCDMKRISEIAKRYNLKIIEDCSQAHGASIEGKSVGNFSDIATWSFCQDKIISTGGEGGMITTNSEEYWEQIWSLKDHGKTNFSVFKKKHPKGFAYKFVHDKLGTNFRMTEMQAAIDRIQLKKLVQWNKTKGNNSQTIMKKLNTLIV